MKRTNLSNQLNIDYPLSSISFDAENSMLTIDNHRISLLSDPDDLKNVNVFSKAGRNYYQAIAQLIYSKYKLLPREGSLADNLIATNEEYNKYRIQNLSSDYGLGFIEDGGKVIAVKISSDIERSALIEEDAGVDIPDYLKEMDNIGDYARLIEIIEKKE